MQTLPLEIKGLTAELNDNVVYYDNGKASPKNSDFSVVAHFTEKGRDFDEILQPTVFDIDVPAGFATEGGTVRVVYEWTPPADENEAGGEEEAETPEPQVLTADVECSLEDVVPVSITARNAPYRVYYPDDMAFDTAGMTASVSFNDGHTEAVDASELHAGAEPLVAGAKNVRVTWSRGGTEISFDYPVTVVRSADYTPGTIRSVAVEGTCYISDGDPISDARLNVRASYDNGNRFIIDKSQYTVTGNTDIASFGKKCLILVTLDSDNDITARAVGTVRSGVEAEALTYSGSSAIDTADETTYVVVQKGAACTATVKSATVAKPVLSLRMAADGDGEDIALADNVKIAVNGRSVTIPSSAKITADGGFYDVDVADIMLEAVSDNAISFEFFGDSVGKFKIDRIGFAAGYKGKFYANTVEYLVDSAAENANVKYNAGFFRDWSITGGMTFGGGLCTDGKYLYAVCKSASSQGTVKVAKYDLGTGDLLSVSAPTDEAHMMDNTALGITYYDGKVIVYAGDGTKMYVDAASFDNDCTFAPYDGFAFKGLENAALKDVYYNEILQRFAVLSGFNVYICDAESNVVSSFYLDEADKANTYLITGNDDHVFVNYSLNGRYIPLVYVYDWNGNYIGKQSVNVSTDFLADNGVYIFGETCVRGIAEIDGSLYASLTRFNQKDANNSTCILRLTMPDIEDNMEYDFTAAEAVDASARIDRPVLFATTPTVGELGAITEAKGLSKGAVAYGEYIYYAAEISFSNPACLIYKVRASDNRVVACSGENSFSMTGDYAARLFVKDGRLYAVSGDIYSIALSDFADGCLLEKDDAMTSFVKDAIGQDVRLQAVCYNADSNKYAVITADKNVLLIDGNGDGEVKNVASGQNNVSSVCGDRYYFYTSQLVSGASEMYIDVYDWNGDKVLTAKACDIGLGPDNSIYHVSSIYMLDDRLHAVLNYYGPVTGNRMVYDRTLGAVLDLLYIEDTKDYVQACVKMNIAPQFDIKPSTSSLGGIAGTPGLPRGAASDGEYLYAACQVSFGNSNVVIYKIRLADNAVVAKSAENAFALANDFTAHMFIKDGRLYCAAGKIYSIALDDFAQNCTLQEDTEMDGLIRAGLGQDIASVCYDAKSGKYAAMRADRSVYIINGDGSGNSVRVAGGRDLTSVVCDARYIYVAHQSDNQTVVPIDIYTWDGSKVCSVEAAGMPSFATGYKISAVYMADGTLHASVNAWNATRQFYDLTLECDMSAFM